ncbi:MAG: hypothetical protein ACI9MR_002317 [Myxococcota bacterium]|jgi:hypothetical protein
MRLAPVFVGVLLAVVACDDMAEPADDATLGQTGQLEQGIALDHPAIVAWAANWEAPVAWGTDVDPQWRLPGEAVGPATGDPAAVVSLGNGGIITLVFETAFGDADGPDLAVYENGFNDTFLELAFVEVSSDGERFVRFPNEYEGTEPVAAFGAHDAALIHGLAGKYRRGLGTPFDLAALADHPAVIDGRVDLQAIRYVRLVDVIGDGTMRDTAGNPIYDPTPSVGTGGFDLDGVAVMRAR